MSLNVLADTEPRSFLHIRITDPEVLRHCHLPFLRHGGLFVPTTAPYSLRQQLFLVLSLPGRTQALGALTTVAWLTPAQSHNGRTMGIGLAFAETDQPLNAYIESVINAPFDADVV